MQTPRVVLFVGHHKVGSTALQEFLSTNCIDLLKAGLLYPMVEAEGLSLLLRAAVDGSAVPRGNFNLREPHNALAFRMVAEERRGKMPSYHAGVPGSEQMFRSIRKQIEVFHPETVVLCAEVFSNFATFGTVLIRKLLDALPKSEIRIVATLRRPDEYLASWHGQRFRFGHPLKPLREDGMDAYLKGIHFDYRLMLETWIAEAGRDAMRLRNYRDGLTRGGAIPDFAEAAEITFSPHLKHDISANASIRYCQYEIARLATNELDRADARAIITALEHQSRASGLPPNDQVDLFGAENRARLVEGFAPINAWLGEQIGKPVFFDDMAEAARPRPVPELEAARIALAQLRGAAEEVKNLPKAARSFIRQLEI